jgi:hypothetical protein
MNKLFLLALMVLAPLHAQDSLARYMTNDLPNGRFWLLLDQKAKGMFVMGCEEAIFFSQVMNAVENGKSQKGDEGLIAARHFYPVGVTREETIKFLDTFFSAPENRQLWIVQGVQIFAMKMQGKPAAEIEDILRLMRMSMQ